MTVAAVKRIKWAEVVHDSKNVNLMNTVEKLVVDFSMQQLNPIVSQTN